MRSSRLLLLSALCIFLFSGDAFACMCEPNFGKKWVFRKSVRAAAIFEGTVKEVTKELNADGYYEYRVVLQVKKSWKCAHRDEVVIYNPFRLCGVGFEVGRSYLVFAWHDRVNEPQKLRTSICNTRRSEDAKKEIKLLGEPGFVSTLSQ